MVGSWFTVDALLPATAFSSSTDDSMALLTFKSRVWRGPKTLMIDPRMARTWVLEVIGYGQWFGRKDGTRASNGQELEVGCSSQRKEVFPAGKGGEMSIGLLT